LIEVDRQSMIGPHAPWVRPELFWRHVVSKTLLVVSAAVEIGAGVALLTTPLVIVELLIGGTLDSPTALAVARLAGAALVTLGLVCWFASRDSQSRAASGVVAALLFYNTMAVGILLYVRLGLGETGVGTWPAIVLHAALAIWCLACIRSGAP
jgi:hypothetical protein